MNERVASLDFLRGAAAICVAVPHFLSYNKIGAAVFDPLSVASVEIFFVLSGFVLAPQILLVLETPSFVPTFLVRRWMRTIPPYFLALVLISILTGTLGIADFWRYLFYVENLFDQHNVNDYYSVAWSLSVEEWFYLTFPLYLIAVSLGRKGTARYYAGAAICFILAITLLRAIFGDSSDWGAGVRRVVAFRLDSIAYGFLLYLAVRHRPLPPTPFVVLATVLSTAAMFVLIGHVRESRAAQLVYPEAAAAFGSCTILAALAFDSAVGRVRSLAKAAGALSYPIYLYHLLIIYLLSLWLWPFWLDLVLFMLATTAVAAASFYGLEQPILAARPRYSIRGESGDSLSGPVTLSR